MKKAEMKNAIYASIINYLETLESEGIYKGNDHHLAQKLVEKITEPLMKELSKDIAIKTWRFEDAPREYKDLSNHGGDEDWIALVPDALEGIYIPWIESGSSFGRYDVSEHKVEGGRIYIGAHA